MSCACCSVVSSVLVPLILRDVRMYGGMIVLRLLRPAVWQALLPCYTTGGLLVVDSCVVLCCCVVSEVDACEVRE